jgi:DNA-binding transcriptional ArsR family regulator
MDNNSENTAYSNIDTVLSPARIAVYDDPLASPKIIDIQPCDTKTFIGTLSATIDSEAKALGGSIPYTVVSQVAQNFIHAYFCEMVVSILDNGNTIRFSDQGPGIKDKEKAQLPGYSSATAQMKQFIDGVGSGLPIVKEYLETKHGIISIEDNIDKGSVVTISLNNKNIDDQPSIQNHTHHDTNIYKQRIPHSDKASSEFFLESLSEKSKLILSMFEDENIWGVQDLSKATNIPQSSTHNALKKLEEAGIVRKVGTKRALTDFGYEVLSGIN